MVTIYLKDQNHLNKEGYDWACRNLLSRKNTPSLGYSEDIGVMIPRTPVGKFESTNTIEVVPAKYRHFLSCVPSFPYPSTLHKITIKKYSFYLHTYLRLNITILKLEVLSYHISKCTHDYIAVQSLSLSRNNSIKFCGKHSSGTNVFPPSHWVILTEIFDIILKRKIFVFSHSVMDQSIIESQSNSAQGSHDFVLAPLSTYYWFQGKEITQTFLLRAQHLEYIHVCTSLASESGFTVLDGPGKKSAEILPSWIPRGKEIYISTSFVVFLSFTTKFFDPLQKIEFKIYLLECEFLQAEDVTEAMLLPVNTKKNTQCLGLAAMQGNSFNITFSDYKYTGDPNTFMCDFAGVALYNVLFKNNYQLVTTECVKVLEKHVFEHICGCNFLWGLTLIHNKEDRKFTYPQQNDSKSVFSSAELVHLVWYSFKEFGFLSVNVSISFTSCTIETVGSDIINKTQCEFKFSHDQCIIVQMLHWQQKRGASCRNLYFEFYLKNKQHYSLSAVGFIEGRYTNQS